MQARTGGRYARHNEPGASRASRVSPCARDHVPACRIEPGHELLTSPSRRCASDRHTATTPVKRAAGRAVRNGVCRCGMPSLCCSTCRSSSADAALLLQAKLAVPAKRGARRLPFACESSRMRNTLVLELHYQPRFERVLEVEDGLAPELTLDAGGQRVAAAEVVVEAQARAEVAVYGNLIVVVPVVVGLAVGQR